MKKIGIVVDSTFNLQESVAENLDFKVVNLNIIIDGVVFTDGVDVTSQDVYEALDNGKKVTTTQPSPDGFLEAYNEYIKEGVTDIICFTVSSGISGTFQSANIAKDLVEKDANIKVVDSKSGAMGCELLISELKEMMLSGDDFSLMHNDIQEIVKNMTTVLTIDDLEVLLKSGRLSKAQTLLGSIMKVKPVMALDEDGKVYIAGKVRTSKKVLDFIVNKVNETINVKDFVHIRIGHINAIERAKNLKHKLEERFENAKVYISKEITPVMSVHLGKGGLGLAWVKK
ncbi:DegV family protein [Mycoplasmatota bacterium WC44]